MNFEAQIQTDYINEAADLISEMEDCFLILEKQPGNSEVIDRLFRMIHTVKGSGSVAGFTKLARFAHQFENLLALIRAGTLTIDKDVIDVMFQANDVLKAWMALPDLDTESEIDATVCLERLTAYCSPHQNQAPKEPMAAFGFFDDVVVHEEKMVILLVDDEPGVLDTYLGFLEDIPATLLTAPNGIEAIAQLRKHTVDVIVTDLKMPEMDGMGLIQFVHKEYPDLPTIFVSGASDRNDVIRLLNAGAYAFLDKPVQREILLNHIRNALRDKTIRDLVLRLTPLNFKAYLASSKLARIRQESQRVELEAAIRETLDELTVLQNEILMAKFPHLKP